MIQQLRQDVRVIASEGGGLRAARSTLHDESQLYGALVVYTDFAGCRHMLVALGAPPKGLRLVRRDLRAACFHLEHASALFTRAVARSSPRTLVAATRSALRAAGPLDRARLRLAA